MPEHLDSYTSHVWRQENGWHWSLTGRGVQPRSGIMSTFVDAVRRVADEMEAEAEVTGITVRAIDKLGRASDPISVEAPSRDRP